MAAGRYSDFEPQQAAHDIRQQQKLMQTKRYSSCCTGAFSRRQLPPDPSISPSLIPQGRIQVRSLAAEEVNVAR